MQDFSCVKMLDLSANVALGDILGTTSSSSIIERINKMGDKGEYYNSSYDQLQAYRQTFIDKLITPVRTAGRVLRSELERVELEERYRAVMNMEMLKHVAPEMFIPILTHKPVLHLLKQGRISGYGYTYEEVLSLKADCERIFDRNGLIEINEHTPVIGGRIWGSSEFRPGDPELTQENMDAIYDTREFIDDVLRDTPWDPTSPDDLRG